MVQKATINRFGAYFVLWKQPKTRALASLKRFARGSEKFVRSAILRCTDITKVFQIPRTTRTNRPPCLPTSGPVHDVRGFAQFHDRKITIWKGFAPPSSGSCGAPHSEKSRMNFSLRKRARFARARLQPSNALPQALPAQSSLDLAFSRIM